MKRLLITEEDRRHIMSLYNILNEKYGEYEEGLDISDTYLQRDKYPGDEKGKREKKFTMNSVGSVIDGIQFIKDGNFGNYKVNFSNQFIKKHLGGIDNIDELLKDISITTEGEPTNRIHFTKGIPQELRGYGLGYLIYKSFIKFLGWASSSMSASRSAQNVWSKIASDSDFYSLFFETIKEQMILTISRDKNEDEIFQIIKKYMNFFSLPIEYLKLDDDIIKNYPNLQQRISLEKEAIDKTYKLVDVIIPFNDIVDELSNFRYQTEKIDIDENKKNEYLKEIAKVENILSPKDSSDFRWVGEHYDNIVESLEFLEDDSYKYKNFPNFIDVVNKSINLLELILTKYEQLG
jgi:hypothetical protein